VAGDRLPTAREVVAKLAINPTQLKAYRELRREGLVTPRPGQGTFVERGPGASRLAGHATKLKGDLARWLAAARSAGLEIEDVDALFRAGLRDASTSRH